MSSREPNLFITNALTIPMSELRFAYVRSSGPGGQNVNKVSSQVQLAWPVAENRTLPADLLERLQVAQRGRISKAGLLRIDSDRTRDREKNREDCLNRLRDMIVEVEKPPKKRRKTKTPRGVIEARLRGKHQRAEVKQARRKPRMDD